MDVRIAFDATFAVGNYRGMGKFTNILLNNPSLKNKSIALLPAGSKAESKIARTEKFGFRFYPLWEQVSLPFHCREKNINYLVCPYNTAPVFLGKKTKLILVVHDLIFLEKNKKNNQESFYQKFAKWYRRLIVPIVIKKAYSIITVSEFSKFEIEKKFDTIKDKIKIIPNSIDAGWFENPDPENTRKDCVFTISGEALSKNLNNVIKAFAIFKANKIFNNYSLIIAGVKSSKQKQFYTLAGELGIRNSITLLNYCPDEEIKSYYKNTKLFLLGSTSEGFGIPLLEAFALGAPVVCSNTGSLPEIAGNAALLFDPVNPVDIANKMSAVLENTVLWKELQEKGFEQSKKYYLSNIEKKISYYWNEILGL